MQLTDTLSHNTCSVCEENFRLHVEKVVVTVTTTFKSGGEMSPPSHTKLCLGLCMYLSVPVIAVLTQYQLMTDRRTLHRTITSHFELKLKLVLFVEVMKKNVFFIGT